MCYSVADFSHAPRAPIPSFFFFFNDTATTEIYTLSLHDALPISMDDDMIPQYELPLKGLARLGYMIPDAWTSLIGKRSEEHTSELQSPCNLVCRLLLEKKKQHQNVTQLPNKTNTHVNTPRID